MTLGRNLFYSALLVIGCISIESLQLLPPKIAAYAIPILMLIQAVISRRAHRFNPDGTPAEQPFLPCKGGKHEFLG
jgi:hypothetical protein